jgi:hypothetical protein
MKNISVTYPNVVTFLGRNGTFKQVGLELSDFSKGKVDFEPITSKNETGRARISVPKAQIPELIQALQQFI